MMSEFKHIRRWERPSNYIGANWNGWYEVIGQHRDSDSVVPHKDGKIKYRVIVRFPTLDVNEETNKVKCQTENCYVRAYSKDGAKVEAGELMSKMFPGKQWMIGGVYKDE
jgi:hypothetical protein